MMGTSGYLTASRPSMSASQAAPAKLGPEEVGVVAFDDNRGPSGFGQALHLEREASVRERSGEIGEGLALDNRNHPIFHQGAVVAGR